MQTAVAHDAPSVVAARANEPLLSGPSGLSRAKGQAPWHFLNFFAAAGAGIVAAYGLERLRTGSWLWLQCGPWT